MPLKHGRGIWRLMTPCQAGRGLLIHRSEPTHWLVFIPNKHLDDFTVKETRPKYYYKEKLRYMLNGGYRLLERQTQMVLKSPYICTYTCIYIEVFTYA